MANSGPASVVTQNLVAVMGASSTASTAPAASGSNMLRLLAMQRGVSVAATGDAAVLTVISATAYSISSILFTNNANSASTTSTNVALWTGPGATGTQLNSTTGLVGLNGPTNVLVKTAGVNINTVQNIYANVSGVAVATTIDVYVYGYDLSV